jgi:hypothetical protein
MRYRAPKWFTVALVLGLLLSASVFLLVRSAGFRTWLTRRAERSLSGLMAAGVEMGSVEGDVLGGVSVVGLSLRDAQGVEVLRAEEATVRWSWQSLLTGSPLIKEIRLADWELLVGPAYAHIQSRQSAGERPLGIFAVERISLENGRAVWQHGDDTHSVDSVNAVLSWGRSPDRDEINLASLECRGDLEIRRAAGSATITRDTAILHKLRVWSRHGEFEASGSYDVGGKGVEGIVLLTQLDLRHAARMAGLGEHVRGRLSAEADVSGTVKQPLIEVIGSVADPSIGGMPLDPFTISLRARGTVWQLEVPDIDSRAGRFRGRLAGQDGANELDLHFDGVDMAEAGRHWDVTLPQSALTGDILVVWSGAPALPGEGKFTLDLQRGTIGRLWLEDARARGSMGDGAIEVEFLRVESTDGVVEATGSTDGRAVEGRFWAETPLEGLLQAAGLASAGGRVRWEGRFSGELASPSVEAFWEGEELRIGPVGAATAGGVVEGAWPEGVSFRTSLVRQATLGPITAREGEFRGRITPRTVSELSCSMVFGPGERLAVSGDIGWRPDSLVATIHRFVFETGESRAEMPQPASLSLTGGRLRVDAPFELQLGEDRLAGLYGDGVSTRVVLAADSLDLFRSLLPRAFPAGGSARCLGTFSGPLRAPTGHADVELEGVRVLRDGPRGSARLVADFRAGAGVLAGEAQVGDLLLASVEGRLTPRGKEGVWSAVPEGWLVVENASLPLAEQLIEEVGGVGLSSLFTAHAGSLTFRARFQDGTWNGRLEVEDGIVTVHEVRSRLSEVKGFALLTAEGMSVEDLRGAHDGGEVTLSGTIPWSGGGVGEYVLQIGGTSVPLSPVDNMWLRGDPTLTLEREGRYKYLHGEVAVEEGLVEGPFWEGGGGGPSRALWDLTLWSPGKVWVRTDNADVETTVDLRLRRRAREYSCEGSVEALRGKLHYLGRHFDLEEGDLTFRGRTPPDPLLSLRSTTTIRSTSPEGEDVIVNFVVEGSLSEPEVVLSSDPGGYTHEQLMAMLVLDLSPEEAQDMSTFLSQELAAAMQGVLTAELARVVRKEAGLDALHLESPGPGQDPAEIQLLVGKYLTPDLYVSIGKELLSSSLDNVRVEYLLHRMRLGKRRMDVRLTGEQEKDEEYGQYRYNVDLKLRYRF